MDFKDQIKQLAERIEKLKDNLQTEEATKNALIMPFLQALGYDVFNPLEVMPEFTCDIGTKKGEKIDYAIFKDGKPIILIECKHWAQDLKLHDNQLLRYFHVSNAKFGVLTNGCIYRFYTDLEKPNVMDEKPFLEVNLSDLRDHQIEELKKFHKSYFDLDNIVNTASDLKYTAEIKSLIQNEMSNPSEWFVRGIAKVVYQGMVTSKVLEQFTALTKKSFSQVISDTITDRLKNALREEESVQPPTAAASEASPPVEPESLIVTTPEELEGFYTVRAALRDVVSMDRIVYRDTQTYFGILLDDNNRKPICRLYFNGVKKYIATFDDNKKEVRHEMTKMDDIFKHTEAMTESIRHYENPIKPVKPVESSATDVEPIADTAM